MKDRKEIDKELVNRILIGDHSAITEIDNHYRELIRSIVKQFLVDDTDCHIDVNHKKWRSKIEIHLL